VKNDLRLVPAALAAWAVAAAALSPGWAFAAGAAVLAVGTAGVFVRRRSSEPSAHHQVVLCAAVALAVLLSARMQLGARLAGGVAAAREAGTPVVAVGTAAEDARRLGPFSASEAAVPLRVASLTADGRTRPAAARVVALGEVAAVHRGDTVRVRGRLVALPDHSDAQALLVDATVEGRAGPRGADAFFGHVRARFLAATAPLGAQGRGLVPGITIGDDSALPDTLREAMRRSSLGHLTAVSGAHVALVLALVGLLGARAPTRLRAAGLLGALAGLVGLVGTEASVVRAAAMGCTGIVALARGRPPRAVPALSAGVVVLLVADPWLAFSIGFALSVAATAALLLLAPPLAAGMMRWGVRRRRLAIAVALPLAAHLACAPIIVLFNPTVSLVGVLANAVAGPAVAPATILGLAGVVAAPLSLPVATALARGAEAFTWWVATTATVAAHLPHSAIAWPGGVGGALALAALHALLVVAILRRARVLVVLLAILGVIALVAGRSGDDWTVLQCDVGQGAALLVRSGPHAAVMVDVGPGDGRSQDCLSRAGITRLDLLVLTHPHADHVGNLPAVLATARVGRVLVSPAAEPAAAVRHVRKELAWAGVQPEPATAGLRGAAGDVHWEVLWPTPGPGDANDLSVTVLLTARDGTRVMPLGDLQSAGQAGLARAVRSCGPRCTGVDVVAMAHHGSRDQDPELAGLLAPAITLVSVGPNAYGHPTAEALDLYGRVGGRVWRTDEDGAVAIVTRGDAELVGVP